MSGQGAAPEGCLVGTSGQRRDRNGNKGNTSTSRPELQWKRGLRALVLHGSLTTRQLADPPIFAHAGHSLAAEWRKKDLVILTEMISVVGYAGTTHRIARYSLAPESRELAARLLAGRR